MVGILGIDVGGTFTDAVLLEEGELRTAKVPTAPAQERSVIEAAAAVGARDLERFTHGTTIATNALITRRFPRPAMVTTKANQRATGTLSPNTRKASEIKYAKPGVSIPMTPL